jgi:hypothetical protein
VSFGTGSLIIAARRAGGRTVLERLRYDGLSRCSRAFTQGDAALVVLSQLGPGVVRGDAVTTSGRLEAQAHLIVTQQTATRLMGGARGARAHATWLLDAEAVLELVGEPLIASADARYDATTTVELGPGARVLISEISCVPAGAEVRMRTLISRGGRELSFDATDPAACAPFTVGTFAVLGVEGARIGALVAALDHATDVLADVRSGVGALPSGVFVRVLGPDIWAVRTALIRLRDAVYNDGALATSVAGVSVQRLINA